MQKEKALISSVSKKVVLEKFESRYVVSGGCWLWIRAVNSNGYGRIQFKQISCLAHRMSLFLFGDGVPHGLVVDHKCKNKRCVNPKHLRIVTAKENALKNNGGVAEVNRNKTHCLRGHPLSGENLYTQKSTGYRYCKECNRRRVLRWHRKNASSAGRHRSTAAT